MWKGCLSQDLNDKEKQPREKVGGGAFQAVDYLAPQDRRERGPCDDLKEGMWPKRQTREREAAKEVREAGRGQTT